VDDFHHRSTSVLRKGGVEDSADGLGVPPLFADDLPRIFSGHAKFKGCPLSASDFQSADIACTSTTARTIFRINVFRRTPSLYARSGHDVVAEKECKPGANVIAQGFCPPFRA
jgi:hypothetical protein